MLTLLEPTLIVMVLNDVPIVPLFAPTRPPVPFAELLLLPTNVPLVDEPLIVPVLVLVATNPPVLEADVALPVTEPDTVTFEIAPALLAAKPPTLVPPDIETLLKLRFLTDEVLANVPKNPIVVVPLREIVKF